MSESQELLHDDESQGGSSETDNETPSRMQRSPDSTLEEGPSWFSGFKRTLSSTAKNIYNTSDIGDLTEHTYGDDYESPLLSVVDESIMQPTLPLYTREEYQPPNQRDMNEKKQSDHGGKNDRWPSVVVTSSPGMKPNFSRSSLLTQSVTKQTRQILRRTPSTFWSDARNFKDGSIPHSIICSFVIGLVCGIILTIYNTLLQFGLDFLWHTIPRNFIIGIWPEWTYIFWIPIVGFSMAIAVGCVVKYVGEPGDLPFTVKAVHEKGYLSFNYVCPMVLASLCTLLGGTSMGPEAPLGTICASVSGFLSRRLFKQTDRNMIRKHTLMGLASALAAFFGSPIGGTLFALEVQSRFGLEYFEHLIESYFSALITLTVFRTCAGLSIGPIWNLTDIGPSRPEFILLGAVLGLLSAVIAACFAHFHWTVMSVFGKLNLLKDENAISRALLASSVFLTIGMFMPYTLFWGEDEFQQIATLGPAENLANVFPTSGLIDFEMDTALNCFLVGVFKLVSISFGIAGGFRGGFIFPLFACGAAFGRCLIFFFPSIPPPYACLCIAAGLNVVITRTSMATPIILVFLSGQPNLISAVSAASATSLFATMYMVRIYIYRHVFCTLLEYLSLTSHMIPFIFSIAFHQIASC